MILLKDTVFKYQNSQNFNFPDISVSPKETLLIHGKSGVGKTTLLNILGLLNKPETGTYQFFGTDAYGLSDYDLQAYRANDISMVFQRTHFIKSLSVWDNILLGSYFSNKKNTFDLANTYLEELGLITLKNKAFTTLSGGEQQRAAIVRALIKQPKLVLADEPTSALDDDNTLKVLNLLRSKCNDQGAALIIVSHDERLKSQVSNQISLSK